MVPSIPKTRVLELAQGAFLAQQENVPLVGPSGLERAAGQRGSRVLFRTAAALANELEVVQ